MKILAWTIIAVVLFDTCAQADSISVDNALKACAVADATGVTSQPCSVSGWNSSVDIFIDTSGSEANKICRGMSSTLRQYGLQFDAKWKIRIYSPFSGGNTIATCPLG